MNDNKQGRSALDVLEWYGFCTFCVLLPWALTCGIALLQGSEVQP